MLQVEIVQDQTAKRQRRGRPPKIEGGGTTKARLIHAGLALMTEKGFSSTGLEDVLSQVGVPKGSFYYYFDSKEAFGKVLIEEYGLYFSKMLDECFLDESYAPLVRFENLITKLRNNMIKYDFQRGCLIGNLGQEMMVIPASFRQQLIDVFYDWQQRTSLLFEKAKTVGELPQSVDCKAMAELFWIGWEGAILRAKLERNAATLDRFAMHFLYQMKQGH